VHPHIAVVVLAGHPIDEVPEHDETVVAVRVAATLREHERLVDNGACRQA
jgi:hypothetical protein